MDALRTERVMLRALLFLRPGAAVFCILIAIAGLATAWLEPSTFRDILAPSLIAISMAACLLIAATRLDACCRSAGALGIRRHLEHARRTAGILLLVFVALPATYLLIMGFGWLGLSVTFAAGAIGVHLFRNTLLVWLVLGLWIAARMGLDAWSFAASSRGALAIVALSLVACVAWVRALTRAHQQGVLDGATLADARHEGAPAAVPSSTDIDKLLATTATGRLSPLVFWGTLGHVSILNWRGTFLFALAALLLFLVLHTYHRGHADSATFLTWSAIAGLLSGWVFFSMQGAWATSAQEQNLLVLSPRWPEPRELKWLVLRTFWSRLPAALVAWLMVAALGLAAGWLSWPIVARGAAGLVSIAFALFGFLLLFLARRRLKKRNRLAMLYLVVTGIAGLLLIPFHQSAGAWRVLCLMLVVPAALALLGFCLRRPQFPVRPDADLVL